MSQHDFTIDNASGSAARADINSALQALASVSAGTLEPATTYAYMLWADTLTSLLKMRNGANNGWVSLGDFTVPNLGSLTSYFDVGTKMIFYQPSRPTGWTKDTSHNDKALRVVSGAGGGFGGIHDLSTPPSLSHSHPLEQHVHATPASGSWALTKAQIPLHVHTSQTITYAAGYGGGQNGAVPTGDVTGNGLADGLAGQSHFHPSGGNTLGPSVNASPVLTVLTAFSPKYIDVIVCIKDP